MALWSEYESVLGDMMEEQSHPGFLKNDNPGGPNGVSQAWSRINTFVLALKYLDGVESQPHQTHRISSNLNYSLLLIA